MPAATTIPPRRTTATAAARPCTGGNHEHAAALPAAFASRSQEPAALETGFDEEAWRAIVGKNADYYLPRFRALAAGGPSPRWHWPAFFITWYWLLHRKMWGLSFVYLFSPYLIGIVGGVLVAMMATSGDSAQNALTLGLFLLFFVVPPLFANTWYFRHCEKLMEKVRAQASSRDRYLGVLSAKGGSGGAAVIAIVVLVLLFVVGILAALAIPAYSDYTKRAKLAEVAFMGRSAATALAEHHRQTRQIPARLDDIPGAPKQWPAIVNRVEVDQQNGEISVHLHDPRGTLKLLPRVNGNEVAIQCSSPDIRQALLPQICRTPR